MRLEAASAASARVANAIPRPMEQPRSAPAMAQVSVAAMRPRQVLWSPGTRRPSASVIPASIGALRRGPRRYPEPTALRARDRGAREPWSQFGSTAAKEAIRVGISAYRYTFILTDILELTSVKRGCSIAGDHESDVPRRRRWTPLGCRRKRRNMPTVANPPNTRPHCRSIRRSRSVQRSGDCIPSRYRRRSPLWRMCGRASPAIWGARTTR